MDFERRSLLGTVGTVAIGSALSGCLEEDPAMENPVYEPILADPSIVRDEDGTWYAFGTEDAWPGVDCDLQPTPIVRSENLTDWEYVGNAFEQRPDWYPGGFVWAPDVNRYDGQYYLYYARSEFDAPNSGIGVATADHPEGPWEDQGKVFDDQEIDSDNSIDPHFLVDDGTPYLVWGSFPIEPVDDAADEPGIDIVELTEDGTDWVEGTRRELAGSVYEGATLVEREGFYYLFVTTGGCCGGADDSYEVEVGRSEDLLGPYLNQNGTDLREFRGGVPGWNQGDPILAAGDSFGAPGHNNVFTDDDGRYWTVYHAYDRDEPDFLCGGSPRRSMMLDRIEWEDDWPRIGDGTPSRYPLDEVDG